MSFLLCPLLVRPSTLVRSPTRSYFSGCRRELGRAQTHFSSLAFPPFARAAISPFRFAVDRSGGYEPTQPMQVCVNVPRDYAHPVRSLRTSWMSRDTHAALDWLRCLVASAAVHPKGKAEPERRERPSGKRRPKKVRGKKKIDKNRRRVPFACSVGAVGAFHPPPPHSTPRVFLVSSVSWVRADCCRNVAACLCRRLVIRSWE